MPFFLPSRLIDFEYFGGGEADEEYEEEAKPYREDIDFAFFVVNFGYSKSDYLELTPREKHFIYKAYENKIVTDTSNMYNACFTANYNANRPKRKRPLKLFKKKAVRKANEEVVKENISIIREVERKEGKNWVDMIYQKNGVKKPKKERWWRKNG